MLEAVALVLASAAVALSYAADDPRGVARWARLGAAGPRRLARLLTLALVTGALLLWRAAEPGPAALLAVPLALLAAGTLITLGAPLARRAPPRSDAAPTSAAFQTPTLGAAPGERGAPSELGAPSERPAPRPSTPRPAHGVLERSLFVLSVTLGTLPVALLASAAVARFLPSSEDTRFAAAFALAIPLWVSTMSVALLARRGTTVLGVCATLCLLLAALVFGVGR